MSTNYYDKDAERQKRKGKKNSFGKIILWIITFIIVAFLAFVITIKIAKPSFDFSLIFPEPISSAIEDPQAFIDDKVWGIKKTTEAPEPTTEAPLVLEPTTMPMMDYIEDSDFKFNTSIQGSQMGTLLNGGLVGTDLRYAYYYIKGEGIHRFLPTTESYALYFGITDKISCINLRGDYIYYVNNKDDGLYKLQKGSSKPKKLADDVEFAYVYASTIYFVTTTGKVCVMDANELIPVTAYYANGDDVKFVGISLTRVFFTVTDYDGTVQYLTVDNYGHSKPYKFREDTDKKEIKKLQLENGFFYYYQRKDDGKYDLVRQKYGSDKIVTLIKNASTLNYPEVDLNRLYFSSFNDGVYRMRELNMNSGAKKTMLTVKNVKKDNSLSFYLGGEYQFIIGEKSENDGHIYKASSIFTSSTNAMQYKNGKWRY